MERTIDVGWAEDGLAFPLAVRSVGDSETIECVDLFEVETTLEFSDLISERWEVEDARGRSLALLVDRCRLHAVGLSFRGELSLWKGRSFGGKEVAVEALDGAFWRAIVDGQAVPGEWNSSQSVALEGDLVRSPTGLGEFHKAWIELARES